MSPRWKEIARLRFKGTRFADRALDASALGEVQRYLRLVEETAKALWRAEHPDRTRLPPGFEESERAYLRRVQSGSAVAVIEARAEDSKQTEFLDRSAEALLIAAEFTHRVYDALAKNHPLPERLPKSLVPAYAEIGKSLADDESLEIKAAGRKRFVAYRRAYSERWSKFAPQQYEDQFSQVGEIVEADVRQSRFQIWAERGMVIAAPFKPDQEEFVTKALRDHRSIRVRVSGRVEFSADGKPLRFVEVTDLSIVPSQEWLFDPNAISIEEEIESIWRTVPASEWKKVPTDLSENLDHYLYGTPRK